MTVSSWDPHPGAATGHSVPSRKQQLLERAPGLQPSVVTSNLLCVCPQGRGQTGRNQSHRQWLYRSGQKHTSPFPPWLACVATDALLQLADLSHPIFN